MTNIFGYCWTYRFITNIEEHVAGYAKLAKDPIESKVRLLAHTPLKDHKVNSIIEIKPHIFFCADNILQTSCYDSVKSPTNRHKQWCVSCNDHNQTKSSGGQKNHPIRDSSISVKYKCD